VRCLLGCLMALAGRKVSGDAEVLVFRHENARPAPPGRDQLDGRLARFAVPADPPAVGGARCWR
jgi:hypothetical protein